jgi:AcrR family transcriptional regulator
LEYQGAHDVPAVSKGDSSTRQHIIDVTEQMLADRSSSEIHLADIADQAHVGVQTIYYHFQSRNQLIAEAQASAYARLTKPLHEFLLRAENAIVEQDQATFWSAMGDNITLAWTHGQLGDQWRISKLLIDIWLDEKTQRQFSERLEIQFDRWINAIEAAKPLGWIDPEIDTYALITSCWAASIGQSLFASSAKICYTPQSMRDFFVSIAIPKL